MTITKNYTKEGLYTIRRRNYMERVYTDKKIIQKEDQTGRNYIKRDYIIQKEDYMERNYLGRGYTGKNYIEEELHYMKKRPYGKKTIQGAIIQE